MIVHMRICTYACCHTYLQCTHFEGILGSCHFRPEFAQSLEQCYSVDKLNTHKNMISGTAVFPSKEKGQHCKPRRGGTTAKAAKERGNP